MTRLERSAHSRHEQVPSPRGTETILLVEDEGAVRSLICQVLSDAGYRVLQAGDSDSALQAAQSYHDVLHLLVTDVVMPGMGGHALAQELLLIHPEMKVLYLSGYTDDKIVRLGIVHEQVNFMQKPFAPTDLVRKVRDVLDASELAST